MFNDGYNAGAKSTDRPTLRDQFATAALQGRITGRCRDIGNDSFNAETCEGLATVSYKIADAMLQVRSKPVDEL
ncbi:MAG: hypothetical protein KAR40_11090 [Candidatus Sabulitectum sp.]|nr:hypothetical protein [Candidatus Sabulitectum sp.]